MFNIFEKYLQSKGNFTADEVARIRSLATSKKIKKGGHLLRIGEVCRYHTFVCNGCLRYYRMDEGGVARVLDFAAGNNWINDEISLFASTPTLGYIDALDNTAVVQISAENFKKLTSTIPGFAVMSHQISLEYMLKNSERVYSMISRKAKDLYQDFKLRYPDLHHRLPLYMVASYLGVTRETLTRIRNDTH